ncbi:hypothetical protein CAEBREN_21643 [Caenorhabditis brenneri]|uniref:ETS domain-containing protein n=1 Tax=Caenorhabditis brenneri TaxID=135651 RepID=G0PLC8_CAEBE|nr:hypothetical protein CAEBREN_21643 [Caenorhabditis brenneri]
MNSVEQHPNFNLVKLQSYLKPIDGSTDKATRTHRLLRFIPRLINSGDYPDKIIWVNEEEREFRFLEPHFFAKLYGKAIGNPDMKYDNMTRSLREYCKQGFAVKTEGQSSWRILNNPVALEVVSRKRRATSPTRPAKRAGSAEAAVSGENNGNTYSEGFLKFAGKFARFDAKLLEGVTDPRSVPFELRATLFSMINSEASNMNVD